MVTRIFRHVPDKHRSWVAMGIGISLVAAGAADQPKCKSAIPIGVFFCILAIMFGVRNVFSNRKPPTHHQPNLGAQGGGAE